MKVTKSPLGPTYTEDEEKAIKAAKIGSLRFMKTFGQNYDAVPDDRIVRNQRAYEPGLSTESMVMKTYVGHFSPEGKLMDVYETMKEAALLSGEKLRTIQSQLNNSRTDVEKREWRRVVLLQDGTVVHFEA